MLRKVIVVKVIYVKRTVRWSVHDPLHEHEDTQVAKHEGKKQDLGQELNQDVDFVFEVTETTIN